jgi:FkbM family methyltransferase
MTNKMFHQQVDLLLSAAPTQHFLAQMQMAEMLINSNPSRILLFGAGGLGRKTLAGLRAQGGVVVAFVDNDPQLVGQLIDGVPVMGMDDALQTYGPDAVIVLTIWRAFASETMQDRIRALRVAGFRKILPFYYLFWLRPSFYTSHFSVADPEEVRREKVGVRAASDLFKDDRSQQEFLSQLHWRLDPEAMPLETLDEEAIYFSKDLYQPIPDEVYVDCGGFDGDTLKDFHRATGGRFSKAIVFEPDPLNFKKLNASAAALSGDSPARVETFPYAVGSRSEELIFQSTGTVSSQISTEGSLRVRCEPLGKVLMNQRITFLKMDIEGAELDAVAGAETLIRKNRPILTICLYHKQNHLWAIPLKIASFVNDYDFHLRTYGKDGWDLVLYAIPSERRK